MKGSAITLEEINEIKLVNNNFIENGPVTSFVEAELSPYFKYFAKGIKSLSKNQPLLFRPCD